jgi:hypothetical protein
LKTWNRNDGCSGIVLKIVERTAIETEGPLGKEGGVDKFVMTWGRRVDIAWLSRTRWIKRLYAGSKSALSIFRLRQYLCLCSSITRSFQQSKSARFPRFHLSSTARRVSPPSGHQVDLLIFGHVQGTTPILPPITMLTIIQFLRKRE